MSRRVFFTTTADGKVVATAAHADPHPDDASPGQQLATDVAKHYRDRWGAKQDLVFFRGQNEFWYLFDASESGRSDLDLPANRVLASWGYSKPDQRVGSRTRLRGFPIPAGGQELDRGHLIALASGGGENVNIVPQASRLNRGHSEAGKRWRSLERFCADNPGVFMFVGLEYDDLTDIPARFEFRVCSRDGTWRVERFDNRDSST